MTLNRNRRWMLALLFAGLLTGHPEGQVIGDRAQEMPKRPRLTDGDINDLATLLRLEDTRQFDEAALRRIMQSENRDVRRRAVVSIGRIVHPMSSTLLEGARTDPDFEVVASAAFSAGQLKDASAVAWLDGLLAASNTPGPVGREAAQSLGKIPDARSAGFIGAIPQCRGVRPQSKDAAIGEALLALGRFPPGGDLAPLTRWMTSRDEEFRWRATWAMFRARDAKAVPHLLKLADDGSPKCGSGPCADYCRHRSTRPASIARS
jgi:HEAT repeat protein